MSPNKTIDMDQDPGEIDEWTVDPSREQPRWGPPLEEHGVVEPQPKTLDMPDGQWKYDPKRKRYYLGQCLDDHPDAKPSGLDEHPGK